MRKEKSYPKCFDPYLRYAISTGFRNFDSFDDKGVLKRRFRLFLLVEFKESGTADEFAAELNAALKEQAVDLGPADDPIPLPPCGPGRRR
jgi:hypothetical protein